MTRRYSVNEETRKEHRRELADWRMQVAIWEQTVEQCERMTEKVLKESDLGERFSMRTFETFKQEKQPNAYKAAKEYADMFGQKQGSGLIFIGSPGTGKTHLAAAIANEIISKYRVPTKFSSYVEMLEAIKRSFDSGDEVISRFKRIDLLIIDDIGREKATEWTNEMIFAITNYRYEHLLPTIITTNYNPKDLARKIGQATVSRMSEMCRGIQMNGADYRIER